MIKSKASTCCFIGHRKIEEAFALKLKLEKTVYMLIEQGVVDFIFGDHSAFNDLCYDVVTQTQKNFPYIRRIHFRVNYPFADEYTERLLVSGFEESVFPQGIALSGKAVYAERNRAMIDASDICIFYCSRLKNQASPSGARKSGTTLAYDYAKKQKKVIYNLFTFDN